MKKPYLEIFGVINQDEKCYEIGIEKHGKIDIEIPKEIRTKNIWTIGALWFFIGELTGWLINNKVHFCFVAELRL